MRIPAPSYFVSGIEQPFAHDPRRRTPSPNFTYHREAADSFQHQPHGIANDGVIIGDENAAANIHDDA